MINTSLCELLGIAHPIVLGGMPTTFNSTALAGSVSEAGGLGILGVTRMDRHGIERCTSAIREATSKPFGLNLLMFLSDEAALETVLGSAPPVLSLAWPRRDQDVAAWVGQAHAAGCRVTYMAADVPEALRGASAGADVIIAQGSEGGGHVGHMSLSTLLPMVVDAVHPAPVVAAGGIADGRGLAAALAFGASGALMGTRFLASEESGLHPNFKQAILASDGHDTLLTAIPDVAAGQDWPGALSRVRRNRFVERWMGRESALRQFRDDASAAIRAARDGGDADEAPLFFGQDAGLIDDLPKAAELVRRVVDEAHEIIRGRLQACTLP